MTTPALKRRPLARAQGSVRCFGAPLALAVALLTGLVGCRSHTARPRFQVALAGAQIPVELVASWLHDAEDYRFEVEQVSPVYLSQHGFENLRAGLCDIACTDRPITPREYQEFGERALRGYRIAFYGYAFYVHPDNPTDSIFAGHISLLFQHKITDWKELGPFEGPIRLIGPHKSTRGGEILMRQARIWLAKPTWEPLESDVGIVEEVAADPYALGFASIGFDQEVRYLGLRMRRNEPPAFPSLEEIESERYGLAKVIYVYMPAAPDATSAAVLDYLFSERGQQVMQATWVWPIPRERARVEIRP